MVASGSRLGGARRLQAPLPYCHRSRTCSSCVPSTAGICSGGMLAASSGSSAGCGLSSTVLQLPIVLRVAESCCWREASSLMRSCSSAAGGAPGPGEACNKQGAEVMAGAAAGIHQAGGVSVCAHASAGLGHFMGWHCTAVLSADTVGAANCLPCDGSSNSTYL